MVGEESLVAVVSFSAGLSVFASCESCQAGWSTSGTHGERQVYMANWGYAENETSVLWKTVRCRWS